MHQRYNRKKKKLNQTPFLHTSIQPTFRRPCLRLPIPTHALQPKMHEARLVDTDIYELLEFVSHPTTSIDRAEK